MVAISYYAVGLAAYILAPFGEAAGIGKVVLLALVTPLVIGGVWLFLRRMRARLDKAEH